MKYKYASIDTFKVMAKNQKMMLFCSMFMILSFNINILLVSSVSIFIVIALLWEIAGYYATIHEMESEFQKLLDNKYYKTVPAIIYEKICNIQNDIPYLKEMELTYFIALNEYGINASVIKNKGKKYLVITLGLAKELINDAIIAKMILLHEFGHLYFNDLHMYIIIYRYIKKCKYIFVYVFLIFILSLISGDYSSFSILISMFTLLLIPVWAKQTHFWCEYRADFFAVINSKYEEYISLLSSINEHKKNIFSPTNLQRIDILEKIKNDSKILSSFKTTITSTL